MLKKRYSDDRLIECGCDEAGRGCLAGPVVAAAVVLPPSYDNPILNDSKQLTAHKRDLLRKEIEQVATAWAVVMLSNEDIDRLNILRASLHAMNLAVQQLTLKPDLLLIDGNRFYDECGIPYHCIVKGDATYMSIAAASILAKTHRDEYMTRLDAEYPLYGWSKNKGYPTKQHYEALQQYGPTPYHRHSFRLLPDPTLDFGE